MTGAKDSCLPGLGRSYYRVHGFLFGSVSLVFGNVSGVNRIFSLYVPEGGTERFFGHTKTFPALPGAPSFYAMSLRNKAFLTGTGAVASLRYGTTEAIRWQQTLPFTVKQRWWAVSTQ